MATNSLKKGE